MDSLIEYWKWVKNTYGENVAETISYYGKEGKALLDTYGIRLAEAIDSVTDGKGAVGLFKELGEDVRVLDVLSEYGDEAYDMLRVGRSVDEVEKVFKGGNKTISQADRIKIDSWDYTPSDELYLKYKDVYDNPKYYDQETGKIHWPADDGFKAGSKIDKIIEKDTIFKRYGDESGEFLGNATDSFETRALAPHSENAEVHYYQLTEDYEMTTGEVAPWFGSDGGAEQFVKYKPDGSKYTIKELEDLGILENITDLVEKGQIGID